MILWWGCNNIPGGISGLFSYIFLRTNQTGNSPGCRWWIRAGLFASPGNAGCAFSFVHAQSAKEHICTTLCSNRNLRIRHSSVTSLNPGKAIACWQSTQRWPILAKTSNARGMLLPALKAWLYSRTAVELSPGVCRGYYLKKEELKNKNLKGPVSEKCALFT